MGIELLHPETDRHSVVLNDVGQTTRNRLLYCDAVQMPNGYAILTALPMPRAVLFLSVNGSVRSAYDIRNVFSIVPDPAHHRLCICLLRSCGLDVTSIGMFFDKPYKFRDDDGNNGSVFFACCNEEELLSGVRDSDRLCPVSYGDALDMKMLGTMMPVVRAQTVYSSDWTPNCVARSLQLFCFVDTVLCLPSSQSVIDRSAALRILSRFSRQVSTTTVALSRHLPVAGITNRVLPSLSIEVGNSKEEPAKTVAKTVLIDSQVFSELFLSTRDGSGSVKETPAVETTRLSVGDRVILRDGGPHQLVATVAGKADDGTFRFSVVHQPDVLKEKANLSKYRCTTLDSDGIVVPVRDASIVNRSKCEGSDPSRLWDRPCVDNDDCPLGSCEVSSGFCDVPTGMRRASYRKFVLNAVDSYPVCVSDVCDPLHMTNADAVSKYVACCTEKNVHRSHA